MRTETTDQIEIEIKRLERDKRIEEIRQLKASRAMQWVTPAALATLIPLFVAFGGWVYSEIKVYSTGFNAAQQLDILKVEKDRLIKENANISNQKDSLNIEISTLLALKKHYADQAREFQEKFEERQTQLTTTYVRARWASAETRYALRHVGAGPKLDVSKFGLLDREIDRLPKETVDTLREIISRYRFAIDMIDASEQILAAFSDTLDLIPAPDWAVKLQWIPSGAVLSDRNIMVLEHSRGKQQRQYYDVDEGRFLSEEESKDAHN